ncbi:putative solute-binding protein, partial [Pseudoalteromonas distincta]|uniref:putative solute-binding protein n=1 Tax=Pseudoalteromonas distincta TaxID=77608 RepID=UPI0034E8F98D
MFCISDDITAAIQLPKSFAMINRLEAQIPGKYKMNLSAEDKLKYQKMLRDGRMDLTKRGIYDAGMIPDP